jgi:hypothetical protein
MSRVGACATRRPYGSVASKRRHSFTTRRTSTKPSPSRVVQREPHQRARGGPRRPAACAPCRPPAFLFHKGIQSTTGGRDSRHSSSIRVASMRVSARFSPPPFRGHLAAGHCVSGKSQRLPNRRENDRRKSAIFARNSSKNWTESGLFHAAENT